MNYKNGINRDQFAFEFKQLFDSPDFNIQQVIDINVNNWLLQEKIRWGF